MAVKDFITVFPPSVPDEPGAGVILRGHYSMGRTDHHEKFKRYDILAFKSLTGTGQQCLSNMLALSRPVETGYFMDEIETVIQVVVNGWPSAREDSDEHINRYISIVTGDMPPSMETDQKVGYRWLISWLQNKVENPGIAGKSNLDQKTMTDLTRALAAVQRNPVKADNEDGTKAQHLRFEDVVAVTFGMTLYKAFKTSGFSRPLDYSALDAYVV